MHHLLRIAAILLAILACLAAATCASAASSLTVVTHGFDPFAELFPGATGGPLTTMGSALYGYWNPRGGAVEYYYSPSTQSLSVHAGDPVTAENTIVVFDWSEDSNDPQAGYDEGAADILFAILMQYRLMDADYVHLIGHSRGGVVSTQAARRMLYYGYDVDQLTLLDVEEGPYPYNLAGPGRAWEGIGYVDNYYGGGDVVFVDVGLGGNQIAGAYNRYVNVAHSVFPGWYENTIANANLVRDGFYWRLASPEERPAATDPRTPLTPPPDVVNGNFQYGISIDDKVAGWWYHGGGGGGHVDLFDVSFEDFDLELDNGDETKRHSWLYAPEDVYRLEFKAQIGGSWLNDDEFWITLQRYDNYQRRVSPFSVDSTRDWRWYSIDISDFADSVFRFTFAIEAPGALNPVDSQVEIDAVRFVRYSAADFDRDGDVDAADLALWQGDYSLNADCDADADGDTDGVDFLIWQRQYIAGVPGLAEELGVPEPASFALLLVSAALAQPSVRAARRGPRSPSHGRRRAS